MRGDQISMTATAASMNTNPTTLTAVATAASYADVFGATGSILVDYEANDTAGRFERGIGLLNLATLSLNKVAPILTFDPTATPKYKATASASLTTFASAVTIECGPSSSTMLPASAMSCNQLGDAISSLGDESISGYSTGGTGLPNGYVGFAPFFWRGGRSVKRASVMCSTAAATAKLIFGIYQFTDHNTVALVQDLTNAGANAFDGTTTGIKSLTSAGGAFSEFWLPPGDYLKCWSIISAAADYMSGNNWQGGKPLLGTTAGVPISVAFKSGSALPATQTLSATTGISTAIGSYRAPILHLGFE